MPADALGCCCMLSSNELVSGRTLLQALQHIEDAALAVVQQQNAEITTKVLVPQGIAIIEEAEVANDAEDLFVSHTGEARCRR